MTTRNLSRKKIDINTVRNWLILFRAHSTGGTLLPLLIGMGTVSHTLFIENTIILICIGVIGHWSVFAHNEIVDLKVDIKNNKSNKPLVSRAINLQHAIIVVAAMLFIFIIFIIILFDDLTVFFALLSLSLGLIYNIRSKQDWFSLIYLSLWGVTITLTGAYYINTASLTTWMTAVLIGLFVGFWTIMGDYKDSYSTDETSLPAMIGVHIRYRNNEQYLKLSRKLELLLYVLLIIMISLMIIIANSNFLRILILIPSIITALIIRQLSYFNTDDDIKRYIGGSLLSFTVAGIIMSSSFLNIQSVILLLCIPLGIGTAIRYFLYDNLIKIDTL